MEVMTHNNVVDNKTHNSYVRLVLLVGIPELSI